MSKNTVFIGGSRSVSRLSAQIIERLDKIIENGHRVIIGDASGVDKAVQKHLSKNRYDNVKVFCSGEIARNNIGNWETQNVIPPKSAKGFQFYAAKDREMAREADFGLMIWDGKSAGTVLNILRLVRASKIAVLINVPDGVTFNIKSLTQWNEFLLQCPTRVVADLRERATPDECELARARASPEPTLFDSQEGEGVAAPPPLSEDEWAATMNAALAAGDPKSVVDALGNIARSHGMTQIAKDTGLARESLYRSLATGGNPEFATVLKVIVALGLRLEASKALQK